MTDLPILEVRFEDYQHYHEEQHKMLKEHVEAKEHALKEQLEAKEHALKERLDHMNEFREEARSIKSTYLNKDTYELQHGMLVEKISVLQGWNKGVIWALGLINLAAVVTLVFILIRGHL